MASSESGVLDNFGEHMFISFKGADGSWGKAFDLTAHGISATAGIATMTPDGKFMFFQDKGDIFWLSTDFLAALKVKK